MTAASQERGEAPRRAAGDDGRRGRAPRWPIRFAAERGPAIDEDGTCPKCRRGTLRLDSDRPDRVFADIGVRVQVWRCDADACDYVLTRRHSPGTR